MGKVSCDGWIKLYRREGSIELSQARFSLLRAGFRSGAAAGAWLAVPRLFGYGRGVPGAEGFVDVDDGG